MPVPCLPCPEGLSLAGLCLEPAGGVKVPAKRYGFSQFKQQLPLSSPWLQRTAPLQLGL